MSLLFPPLCIWEMRERYAKKEISATRGKIDEKNRWQWDFLIELQKLSQVQTTDILFVDQDCE